MRDITILIWCGFGLSFLMGVFATKLVESVIKWFNHNFSSGKKIKL